MARERKGKVKVGVDAPSGGASALLSRINSDTKNWIKNVADEKAAAAGFVFDGERGQRVCDWIETECYLYQGADAGRPLQLVDYQREFVMRLFSWVGKSVDWANRWLRRFTQATLSCAKKNGKTPLEAAIALFLTCSDGEPGNCVYTSAKNGKQAARVQEHAILMVEQSPNLRQVCVINRSTLQITHTPTRSRLMILSGDDTRGAQSAEGANGSIVVDELHVCDREMAERTSRMGRSRMEPINLAVTTAGDDPSSYGYERIKYGRQVNEGKRNDHTCLHVEYAPPETVKDEDLQSEPEKYLRMANPAIGRLVRMSELKADVEKSKDKPREWARCKQYTFNMWVGSISPWLSITNWLANKRNWTLEDLRGRECFLGIDLSRTRDMTAVTLTFPLPEESDEDVFIYPLFWIPKRTAEARRNLYPYLDWAEAGALELTEGNVVDYHAVEDGAATVCENHDLAVTGIYFDPKYAEEMTQRLADRLGTERTSVSQTLMTLSPLCKEIERRTDSGRLHHPGNPVLDWQAGHCQVFRDCNDNIRPVKPEQTSGKCIDGIMSLADTFVGVMGLSGVDDEPGLTFL